MHYLQSGFKTGIMLIDFKTQIKLLQVELVSYTVINKLSSSITKLKWYLFVNFIILATVVDFNGIFF